MAKKNCLYCGLQLPDTTDFCPECGRPTEDAIRVESGEKIRSTNIATGCLYCGLQLPDTPDFCPECGRPIEKGLEIRPTHESELDCPIGIHLRKSLLPSVGARVDDVGLGGPLWSPVGGACYPFISLTAINRATLPSPQATIKALPTQPNPTRPYGSSGLLPIFMA